MIGWIVVVYHFGVRWWAETWLKLSSPHTEPVLMHRVRRQQSLVSPRVLICDRMLDLLIKLVEVSEDLLATSPGKHCSDKVLKDHAYIWKLKKMKTAAKEKPQSQAMSLGNFTDDRMHSNIQTCAKIKMSATLYKLTWCRFLDIVLFSPSVYMPH